MNCSITNYFLSKNKIARSYLSVEYVVECFVYCMERILEDMLLNHIVQKC